MLRAKSLGFSSVKMINWPVGFGFKLANPHITSDLIGIHSNRLVNELFGQQISISGRKLWEEQLVTPPTRRVWAEPEGIGPLGLRRIRNQRLSHFLPPPLPPPSSQQSDFPRLRRARNLIGCSALYPPLMIVSNAAAHPAF